MPRIRVVTVGTAEQRAVAMRVWAVADAVRRRPAGEVRTARVRHKVETAELLLLAHYGERPAGMLIAETYLEDGVPDPSTGHVAMVFVDPAVWGSRVGGALVHAAQGHTWDRLSAWTRADNRRAQRLFAGTGFRPSGHRSQLQDGDEIVRYVWQRPGPSQ